MTLSAPSSVGSEAVTVTVTATGNLAALPNGTPVAIDVDLNNNGSFTDPGETNYATGTLVNGSATITLPGFSATGTYPMRARVTDLAGNQGTSSTQTVVVTSDHAWVVNRAQVLSSDPVTGHGRAAIRQRDRRASRSTSIRVRGPRRAATRPWSTTLTKCR